ncbi:MAG: heme NO-binding domain-containing protein [Spirochaetes bacterium]|nr:heme NO-binding domain-containing protein [Spirochaetota bacterium]
MHGMVFSELKKFVEIALGAQGWDQLLTDSGLGKKVYLSSKAYPDEEIVALISGASQKTGKPLNELLRDFGTFIAPSLISLYGHLLDPEWRTLDVIEQTEEVVHTVVRAKNPGAEPPKLIVERLSPDEVVLHYKSARKLADVAVGIGRGVGKHFKEKLEIRISNRQPDGSADIYFKRIPRV